MAQRENNMTMVLKLGTGGDGQEHVETPNNIR